MTQIAMKFVQWDVPELDGLKDSKVYRLRERLNNGDKLTREEKNWLTRNVWELSFQAGDCLGRLPFRFFGRAETVFCQAVRAHNGVLRHRQDSLAFDAVRKN